MFGIDGQELLVIIIILVVVVGPKDLPKMLRAFARATARMRTTAQEFRHQFDEAMREMEMEELSTTVQDMKKLDPRNSLTQIFDPIRSATNDLQAEIQKAAAPEGQESPAVPIVADGEERGMKEMAGMEKQDVPVQEEAEKSDRKGAEV